VGAGALAESPADLSLPAAGAASGPPAVDAEAERTAGKDETGALRVAAAVVPAPFSVEAGAPRVAAGVGPELLAEEAGALRVAAAVK
jgi:hypothetical protein